jgi:glycosyltransferase involved in cell wall biosynthesis
MTRENTQEKSDQTVVMVIGMHRSGTSLLSSFVQALGINIGDRLYPADNYNPAGYFEDHECMEIQERILEGLGRQWHTEQGMLPFPSAWWREAAMRPFVEELEDWLDRRLSSSGRIWAFKDPRTTRFLPLWQELFQSRGIIACYVLAIRNPSEVVASVTNRSAVPTGQIYRTWLRYNMEALLVGGKELAGVFDYANWFTDGIAQLRRLALILGRNLKDDELTIILGSLLREELYHQNVDGQISPAWALKFYEGLRQIAGNLDEAYIARLATEAEYFDAMLRQGEEPAIEGPVEAVFSSKEGLPAALQLAQGLRERGTRVVVGVTETIPEVTTVEAPVLLVESNGPVLQGWLHTLATYSLWRWLQSRAYTAVHIEGGYGLAAHCLVGRNQGWSDSCGSIHVHYFSSPAWLEENGNLHLRGGLDAEAFYLEQRVLSDPACQIHAHPALHAVLRRVMAGSTVVYNAPVPVPSGEPLVSVCITHYNRALLLHDCLESVRRQTYGNFEVVLVDDGSTEPSALAFLDSLTEEFKTKNWNLIRQENRYLGAARNKAASVARGEYLFMLDDDNLLVPDGLSLAVMVAQRTGADIVTAVMQLFEGKAGQKAALPDKLWVQAGDSLLLGLLENNFGDANALIRRDCWVELGGYTEDRGLGAEDWEFYAKAIFLGRRLEYSLKAFSWYRIEPSSMSRAGNWWSDYRRALRSYEAVLPPTLRELPALAGVLNRRVVQLEPFEPEVLILREHVEHLRSLLMTAESRFAEAEASLAETQRRVMRIQQEVEALNHERQIVYASSSWRLTAPLRAIKQRAINFRSSLIWSVIRNIRVSMRAVLDRHGLPGVIRRLPHYLKRVLHNPKALIADLESQPHFLAPSEDFFFEVPFKYQLILTQTPKVAVLCHIFYPELAEEFISYFENIPFAFDLFISTDTDDKADMIRGAFKDAGIRQIEIRIVVNRGRDIAPKLIAFKDIYLRYEFFLHVHTKRSPQLDILADWRSYLLKTLLGSEQIVISIFDAFAADPALGIIAPEHFPAVRSAIGWGWNFEEATKFGERLGIELRLDGRVDFPSGSMFWGRSAVLRPLLDLELSLVDFPEEQGQLDGTLAHVIERFFFYVCEKSGYRWIKIGRRELGADPSKAIDVDRQAELLELIRSSQYDLLGHNDVPRDSSKAGATRLGLHQWRLAHSRSALKELPFGRFEQEVHTFIGGGKGLIDFDDAFYLAANQDVARQVKSGSIACGYIHFCLWGQFENRPFSDNALKRRFGLSPSYPTGFLAPIPQQPRQENINLSELPISEGLSILILFSHLQEDLFFAGYTEFFKDYADIFDAASEITIAVQQQSYDANLVKKYSKNIKVIGFDGFKQLKHKPDLLIAFSAHLTATAIGMLPSDPEKIVYYCQEFESGFFPFGDDYISAQRAIYDVKNIIISTGLLEKFLADKALLHTQKRFITRPRIETLMVDATKTKRLFFYYRPESFHARNLPVSIMAAVEAFCTRNTGFELFLVGSVGTSYSFERNANQIFVIQKLPKEDYVALIASCDVVVSFIYAAHPGVVAFQAAASGIPTITNIFENRDFNTLKSISKNFLPIDPVRDSLLDAIMQALQMPKGQSDFNDALYAGSNSESFFDFHRALLGSKLKGAREPMP